MVSRAELEITPQPIPRSCRTILAPVAQGIVLGAFITAWDARDVGELVAMPEDL